MKPLSLTSVLTSCVVGGLSGAIVNTVLLGLTYLPIMITPYLGLLSVAIAIVLVMYGRQVKALRDGQPQACDPVFAARVVLFARSSAMVCAFLSGICLGVVVTNLPRIEAPALWESTWGGAIAGVGLLLWMSAGIVVEKWGQRPEDDQPHTSARVTS